METVALSEAARILLRLCTTGRNPAVDDATRPTYRELAAAGVMVPISTFTRGEESYYRFTREGWDRREELIGAPAPHP